MRLQGYEATETRVMMVGMDPDSFTRPYQPMEADSAHIRMCDSAAESVKWLLDLPKTT